MELEDELEGPAVEGRVDALAVKNTRFDLFGTGHDSVLEENDDGSHI